jgi:hypothetical protein
LVYVVRVRNGFVPATRRSVFLRLQPLVAANCPFVNLPEAEKGRSGTGLTGHAKFGGLREDKTPRTVTKERTDET